MFDFAVVGAGPAGTRFARQAADEGASVVVLERGEVGRPLACSGHVSLDIWDYLPDSAREKLFQNAIRGARFHPTGPGNDGYRFYRDEPISNAIDRVGLDIHLAAAAERAGAEIRTGHTVTAVDEGNDSVEVTVSTPEGTESVAARMVAGCDGALSRVRDAVDLPAPEELLHGILAFAESPDHGDFVDVHLTVPGFFAWRIPRGDAGVEYGLAARPDADPMDRFRTFVASYGVETGETCAGAIPIGPPDRVTSHRTFLIGDAAAQTKPFTGGGILYGMRAADAAAASIDPADPGSLAAYEHAWRADLLTEIRLGRWIRRTYSWPRPLQRLGLRLTAGEIGVHMDRPSTLFSWEHLRRTLPGGRF